MKLVVMLFLYVGLLALHGFLTDRCLCRWERTEGLSHRLRKFWLSVYVLFSAFPILGAVLPDISIRYVLQGAGNLWLGFVLYYGGLLSCLYLLGLFIRLFRRKRPGRGAGYGAILCLSLLGALCIFCYGLYHAQQTKVVSYELLVEKPVSGQVPSAEGEDLSEDLEGGQEMTLVLLGDLHLGVNSALSTTKRMVKLVNAQHPDVVVIAGDIFTSCYFGLSHPEEYAKALSQMEARYGVYAVYGNHDVEESLFGGFAISPVSKAFRTREIEEFMEACSFQMLYDSGVTLPGGVQLMGRVDGEKAGDGTNNRMSAVEFLKEADQSLPIFVLEHEPIDYQNLSEAGADVVLSGHTHAGQIFPGSMIVPYFNENAWGHKVIHGMDTFVTAGVGYYGPPMRVGTDSEVTVIHVRFQERG